MTTLPDPVEPGTVRVVENGESRLLPAPPEDDQPKAPSAAAGPQWVQNLQPTKLWSSQLADASVFTEVPAGSYLLVQGPSQSGRTPVYYVGDGLFRKPGGAWVDASAVQAIDAPPPGAVPQVDSYAQRSLPGWVQAHRATTLWSGPDGRGVALTDLPQWSYLKVDGLERGGRLLVWYAGDYISRQPGIGWVDQSAVGPAGEPGQWVANYRASTLWSGPDDKAQRFTDLPQWSKLRLVPGAPGGAPRLLVEVFGDAAGRQPGIAWIAREDVGPITPPAPLPVPVWPGRQLGANAQGPLVQGRSYESEEAFIEAVAEAARQSTHRPNVPVSVTIAQAILESDWGRSQLSRQANNLFGIKALTGPGPAGTVTFSTWESQDGQDVVIQAPFKAYNSLQESVDDHGWFFVRNPRYAGALAVADDPRAFAQEIQRAGYATDPAYTDKLVQLMDRYNLYRFDAR